MIRDIRNAILIVVAGILTYGAIVGSYLPNDPGDPEPQYPNLAVFFTLLGIIAFVAAITQFYRQKKYWWIIMAINIILSIAAVTCLLPQVGA